MTLRLALLIVLLAPAAGAQSIFDLDRLDGLFERPPKVEVNLRGGLLGLAAAATAESEPEVSDMIRSLNAITVRVYPLSSARPSMQRDVTQMLDAFESDGWYTMIRVRSDPADAVGLAEGEEPDDEDVWIYVRDLDDAFGGLAVVALDRADGEAVFVHIDGLIDPAEVGRLTSRFGNVSWGNDDEDDETDEDDGDE